MTVPANAPTPLYLGGRSSPASIDTAESQRREPGVAPNLIAKTVCGRLRDADGAAGFRILALDALSMWKLAAKMRADEARRLDHRMAADFRGPSSRGTLKRSDPQLAAMFFLRMICSLRESILFDREDAAANLDCESRSRHTIDIFLQGAASRAKKTRFEG